MEETTLEKLRKSIFEMRKGYPLYWYFGKIEYYFEKGLGEKAVEILKKDGIIEFPSEKEIKELNNKLTTEQRIRLNAEGKKEPKWYRLTEKGMQMAFSFSTRKKIDTLKWIAVVLAGIGIVVALAHYFLSYAQFPLF